MQTFVEFLWFVAKAMVVYIVAGAIISYGIEKYFTTKIETFNEFLESLTTKIKEAKEKKNGTC